MRFFLSFLFALLLVGAGIAFMTMSSAEQGGWGLSLSMPGKDPAIAPDIPAPQESIELAQASQPQAVPTATGVPPQQMPGEPIGDWLLKLRNQSSDVGETLFDRAADPEQSIELGGLCLGDRQ